MDWYKVKIKNKEDRIKLASILIDNGYTVRMAEEKKQGSTTKQYFIEYKEDKE